MGDEYGWCSSVFVGVRGVKDCRLSRGADGRTRSWCRVYRRLVPSASRSRGDLHLGDAQGHQLSSTSSTSAPISLYVLMVAWPCTAGHTAQKSVCTSQSAAIIEWRSLRCCTRAVEMLSWRAEPLRALHYHMADPSAADRLHKALLSLCQALRWLDSRLL